MEKLNIPNNKLQIMFSCAMQALPFQENSDLISQKYLSPKISVDYLYENQKLNSHPHNTAVYDPEITSKSTINLDDDPAYKDSRVSTPQALENHLILLRHSLQKIKQKEVKILKQLKTQKCSN